MEVLVLDDDPYFRELIAPSLRELGHEVFEAGCASEADVFLSTHTFELLIVDGILPDADGIEWITRVRIHHPTVKIVYVSRIWRDESSYGFRFLTDELGVSRVVRKPVVPAEFVEEIAALILGSATKKATPRGIDERMQVLHGKYSLALPQKLADLTNSLKDAHKSGDGLGLAILQAHKLRGTAPSYGFLAIGEASGRLEDLLRAAASATVITDWESIWKAVDEIRDALTQKPKVQVDTNQREQETLLVYGHSKEEMADTLRDATLDLKIKFTNDVSSAMRGCDIASLLLVDEPSLTFDDASNLIKTLRMNNEDAPVGFSIELSNNFTKGQLLYLGVEYSFETLCDKDRISTLVRTMIEDSKSFLPRVLVCDDDASMCSLLLRLLNRQKITATAIQDQTQLESTLESFEPDLLLLDVDLGGECGFDVCRKLRISEDDRWRCLPIVFLTARSDLESRLEGFQAGGDDYLLKPIAASELIARVGRQIERDRLIRQRWKLDLPTGLLSREAFLEALNRRTASGARRCSICQLEVATNIEPEENQALIDFGTLLKRRFRPQDLKCRWSNERFVLALFEVDSSAVEQSFALLESDFSNRQPSSLPVPVTLRHGIAHGAISEHSTLTDLLKESYTRLSEAKSRNSKLKNVRTRRSARKRKT